MKPEIIGQQEARRRLALGQLGRRERIIDTLQAWLEKWRIAVTSFIEVMLL